MKMWSAMAGAAVGILFGAAAVPAREPGDPIRLAWREGDVAGLSTIYNPEGNEPIGFVEYHQTRRGDLLTSVRVARFADGSSDEDWADAEVGATLVARSGRSIIRAADGTAVVDIKIDVAGGRITGSWGRGDERETLDERVELPAGTYWGQLIFIVLKNFETNAEDGRVVFRTVVPTPRPRVLDMELSRQATEKLERAGSRLEATRFELTPTVHWAVDPVIRLVVPKAVFWVLPGDPPGLARFAGPRNYQRQVIRIQ